MLNSRALTAPSVRALTIREPTMPKVIARASRLVKHLDGASVLDPSKLLDVPEETPYDISNLAAELKRWREAKGFSMRGLSKLAGLSPAHVEQIEKQRVGSVEYPTLVALAAALGIEVATLTHVLGQSPPEATPKRFVVPDDPEPNRPAAIFLLKGKVDEETREALPLVSHKGPPLSIDEWYQKGLELDEIRKRPRTPKPPDPPPAPPPVSRGELLERRDKMKPRKR